MNAEVVNRKVTGVSWQAGFPTPLPNFGIIGPMHEEKIPIASFWFYLGIQVGIHTVRTALTR